MYRHCAVIFFFHAILKIVYKLMSRHKVHFTWHFSMKGDNGIPYAIIMYEQIMDTDYLRKTRCGINNILNELLIGL